MQLNSLIIRILDSFGAFEKVSDGSLVGQDSAQYPEDIERCSSKLTVVFDNSHEAVCDDCNIYLYSHSVLAGSPKGEHTKMLFYPLMDFILIIADILRIRIANTNQILLSL